MVWDGYLDPIVPVCSGCAILGLNGSLCGKKGDWKAKADEQQAYGKALQDIASQQGKSLNYAGKKFMIIQAVDDFILAQQGKEALVVRKTKTLAVCAHTNEGQVPGQASAKLDWAARALIDANY